jgi:hypothetical protein
VTRARQRARASRDWGEHADVRIKPPKPPDLPPLADLDNTVTNAAGQFDQRRAEELIMELSASDRRYDNRLSGLLTASGFVVAFVGLLFSLHAKIGRGWLIAAAIFGFGAFYLALTAQQYLVERAPGVTADRNAIRVAHELHSYRVSLARTATWLIAVALAIIVIAASTA